MRKASITLIFLVVIASLLVSGCKLQRKETATKKKESAATPVAVASVELHDMQEKVSVTGKLAAATEVTVGPRNPGELVWVIGDTGTPVKKGKLVAQIDDTDAKIQVRAATAAVNAAHARLEQAEAATLQQRSATSTGILSANAAVAAAEARLKQAQTSRNALKATTEAQIAQAQQLLNAANSRYDIVKSGARSQERDIAQNNVRLAEVTLNNDAATRDRYQKLYTEGAVSKSMLDSAETKYQISQAQYDSATQQLSLIKEGARSEDIDAAKAAVEQARAQLDSAIAGRQQVDVASDNMAIAQTGVDQAKASLESAKASVNVDAMRDKDVLAAQQAVSQAGETRAAAEQMLANTKIYAPVSGVVEERIAEVGQSVGANAAVLRLTTNSALCFEAQVSELEASRLQLGQSVYLTIDAQQGDRANVYRQEKSSQVVGTVECIVPVVDERTRNFTVRVVVSDTPQLFPGMFARGEIVVATHRAVPVIAKAALLERDGEQYVFAVQDGKARKCPVTVGATDGDLLQIMSGLAPGAQVITMGNQSLADGDRVTITDK